MDNKEISAISKANEFAAKGDLEQLSAWLKQGNNPNEYDSEGWTPLLKASVRGHHEAVKLLLDNNANIEMEHAVSKALAIHFAGHSGSVDTARVLLDKQPNHMNAIWDLNGHTILLQAAFYGHLALAKFMVERGADTSIPTARGLGPMEMAKQFQNQPMIDILAPYDTPAEKKAENYQKFLRHVAPIIPPGEEEIQKLSDELIQVIESGLAKAATDPASADVTLQTIKDIIEVKHAEVNRLGGKLQQSPLIVVATGNNGFPPNPIVTNLRNNIAKYLLEKGADPAQHEVHPMGVQTIIRACVFNHLDILKMCAQHMTKEALAYNLNEIPIANGLTALHDTVMRATMADTSHFETYLDQTRWCIENGARSDIEDFSGRTQQSIAINAADKEKGKRLLEILLQQH
jgi:ankyrin repeat protein